MGDGSGVRRKRLKKTASFREGFRAVLACRVQEGAGPEELGLEPTYLNQIVFAAVKKAAGGDTAAARFIRDTVGEKPEEEGQGSPTAEPDLSGLTDEQLRAILREGREKR